MPDDNELLRQFADHRVEAAFTALVQRHLPMVYAAASRQTGDAHRAEEISLAAFTLLARKARALRSHPALGGWLYTTTGHLAARLRRSEARRHRREQEAHIMREAESLAGEITSEELRPVVDAILLALPERARTAVLLRYFENRSHAEIGRQLGVSENAARMRVDRALEQLRAALLQRGIASTSAALGAALAAQATLTPPAGLAAGIVSGAVAAATTGGSLLFLMNTSLLKTGIALAVVGVAGGGLLWQRHENRQLRMEIASLRADLKAARAAARPTPSAETAAPTGRGSDALSVRLAALQRSPAESWQQRADLLRELMHQVPELTIPELRLATDEDWLAATKEPLLTEADYRRAMAQVRTAVVMRFGAELQQALRAYLDAHAQVFPQNAGDLEPYLASAIGPEALQRYKISPASRYSSLALGGDSILTTKSPADPDYDTELAIGPGGMGTLLHRDLVIVPVVNAYQAANPNRPLTSPAELLPYATTNSQRRAIEAAMAKK